jgi:hypothetical protein
MIDYALFPRDACADALQKCPSLSPCACDLATENCIQTVWDCKTCPYTYCVPKAPSSSSSSSNSGGVSKGALAGAIVGTLIFLVCVVALFIWYRRKSRAMPHIKDVPAAAETVLKRPDPMEKSLPTVEPNVRVYSSSSNTTIDLDPESQHQSPRSATRALSIGSAPSNPFEDGNSIQTAGTEGTNVIPIALVSPDQPMPNRPVRSPDLTLNYNLEHVNVSDDSVRPGGYASSQISGISGFSSRNSYMSNASYSSDLLNEAPMIVTANKSQVRQVLGVVKPAVISATAISPTLSEGLKPPPAFARRPSVGSPLASSSFGPLDVTNESDDGHNGSDPFDDKHCSTVTNLASPAASVATFGQVSPMPTGHTSTNAEWGTPAVPYNPDDGFSRPSSMFTQAGSVIGIENATRVNLAMSYASSGPQTASSIRTPNRTTMGRLLTPPTSSSSLGTLEEQQQQALLHTQARAHVTAQDPSRRISESSVLSSASSTRTDSILESFPFVPPSPISNRPMRTPPVSPLGQQTFNASITPASPLNKQAFTNADQFDEAELPPPPNRRTLGLSTGSQFSTASSGLGSFPFQIDSGNDTEPATAISVNGRQRASLDTLAITNDLASYPLGFDRDSNLPYQQD